MQSTFLPRVLPRSSRSPALVSLPLLRRDVLEAEPPLTPRTPHHGAATERPPERRVQIRETNVLTIKTDIAIELYEAAKKSLKALQYVAGHIGGKCGETAAGPIDPLMTAISKMEMELAQALNPAGFREAVANEVGRQAAKARGDFAGVRIGQPDPHEAESETR
jgi:hypothetical protein